METTKVPARFPLRPSATRDQSSAPRKGHRRYGEVVRSALIVLWETSDRVCSKRRKPLIKVLLPALERHGKLAVEPAICAQLERSAATIQRMLSGVRVVAAGGRRRGRV